ncbi:hypothetical protein ACKXGF_01485 [Alkalibacillus sp. S2W]|uniref:hypothetical protein n=1 Tax=Alkalibacillus sp. S2W TaxID=3386553 RepID=UPI00398D60B6
MTVMTYLSLLLVLVIALAIGLMMEKLQKTSWFRSRFLMTYMACLAVGFVAYFILVAPTQAQDDKPVQSLTDSEVKEAVTNQDMSIIEDLVIAGEWSVPIDHSLSLVPINAGLRTGGYMIVNENDRLVDQATIKLYRPPSLIVHGRQLHVDPVVNATINEGQIQVGEEKLEVEYVTLGQSLFYEYYNGESNRYDSEFSMINYSVLVVEVPPNTDVTNKLSVKSVN